MNKCICIKEYEWFGKITSVDEICNLEILNLTNAHYIGLSDNEYVYYINDFMRIGSEDIFKTHFMLWSEYLRIERDKKISNLLGN